MARFDGISVVARNCSGCMRCALACSFFTTREKAFNPAASRIQITPGARDGRFEVQFTPECTSCGLCVDYCEFGVLSGVRGQD